ncbi:MAG TPA: TolC family protein [Planctomycetota bacterium]|nr:TolC family protein [Planctomycetota bacterium]
MLHPRRPAVFLTALSLSACAVYEPEPLDEAALRAAYRSRAPDDASTVAFAARLRAEGVVGAPAVFDPVDGLSASEGEAVALLFNPDLRLARADLATADVAAALAGLPADPTLGVSSERILASVDDPWILGGTFGVSLPLSGRLDAERDLADVERRLAAADVLVAEWRVRHAVRRAFQAWRAETLRADVLAEHLARLATTAEVLDRRAAAGETPRLETRLFALESAARDADLQVARGRAAERELEIRALLGLAPSAPLALAGEAEAAPNIDVVAASDGACADHPEVVRARVAYAAAEAGLKLATARRTPDLGLTPGASWEDGAMRALFGLALPLPWRNGGRREAAEAASARARARFAFAAAAETAEARVAAAAARFATATRVRAALEASLAPLADAQWEETARVAEARGFAPLPLLEGAGRRVDARLRLVDARLEEDLAAIDWREAAGPFPRPASDSRPASETSR